MFRKEAIRLQPNFHNIIFIYIHKNVRLDFNKNVFSIKIGRQSINGQLVNCKNFRVYLAIVTVFFFFFFFVFLFCLFSLTEPPVLPTGGVQDDS